MQWLYASDTTSPLPLILIAYYAPYYPINSYSFKFHSLLPDDRSSGKYAIHNPILNVIVEFLSMIGDDVQVFNINEGCQMEPGVCLGKGKATCTKRLLGLKQLTQRRNQPRPLFTRRLVAGMQSEIFICYMWTYMVPINLTRGITTGIVSMITFAEKVEAGNWYGGSPANRGQASDLKCCPH